jgi:putative CocE/NonD family hydrolase
MTPALVRSARLAAALTIFVSLSPVVAHAQTSPTAMVFAPQGASQDRFSAVTTPVAIKVPAHDGIDLAARVYRPDTSSEPDWLTPVILVHSPYYDGVTQGDAERSLDIVDYFTPKGYTVVLSAVRGTGNSGGCPEQDGPNQAKDFKTLVEYFAAQPWSNGQVGSYGKSYDAETQNAGAVLRPEGLETMVTVAGISSLYDVAYFDGVPLAGNGAASAAVYAPYGLDQSSNPVNATHNAERNQCQPDNFINALDPSGDLSPYWADREFRLGVRDVEASVLYVQGLNDFTVAPIDIDGWYDELPTFKKAIFGQWAHKYPYDAPANLARDDWYDTVHAWFDHELLDLDTGVESWPDVQVQDEQNVWHAVSSFAGMGIEQPLPLGNSVLGEAGGPGATVGYTEGVSSATWTGPVLDEALHLSGQAFLDATIAIDRPDAHLAVTLQEVRQVGNPRTLTRGYLSVQHTENRFRGVDATANYPVPYRVRTYPFDKTLAAGSRLRVVLAGSDSSTVPAGNAYTGTVSVDGSSVLRVPVADDSCGLVVAQRQAPRGEIPPCPKGQPEATPRYEPNAARGHEASATVLRTTTEKVGDTNVIREAGYLTVRDGTQLAYEYVRPAGEGPFPTLLTYDGYNAGTTPDPSYISRYIPRGYAFMGLNLRGTGCSGGVFDFFQPSEGPDGFEAVEWIARQGWSNGSIGMIGKSYPGITQLFVAEAQPPHLSAISPGHYFIDAYRDVAFPGGILNYAFASLWSFIAEPAPGVQDQGPETGARNDTCTVNATKYGRNARTNPFVQALEHPYDDALIRSRSPLYNLDKIEVPVYAALAWEDEQLASRQVHSLEWFERYGITYRAVLSNGDHGMYRRAPQMQQLDRFIEAHVEKRNVLRDGTPRARYLAEPAVSVYWEQNAGNQPRWKTTLESWTDHATAERLYFGDGNRLESTPPAIEASSPYAYTPASSQGIGNFAYSGVSGEPNHYLWGDYSPPENAALAYTSAPFGETQTFLGSGSVDLWLTATAPSTDLQVTLTEIRPDGQEVFIQQGWLRADQRAIDPHESTELKPVQTHQAEDVRALSPLEPSLARVEIFPFGHVVRAGSRIRVWVEAPTVLPQLWGFALDPTPSVVSVYRGGNHASSLVLPLIETQLPEGASALPACGSVTRQPCRANPRAV